MNEKIIKDIEELNNAIKNDPRYLEFISATKELESDKEAISLSLKKDEINAKYCDMVKFFGENSIEAENAQKELFEIKSKLDELPVVKKYYAANKKYREIYQTINNNLFDDFTSPYKRNK